MKVLLSFAEALVISTHVSHWSEPYKRLGGWQQ